MNLDTHREARAVKGDGWALYYSQEGYPYYHNEETGESEWAPYDGPIEKVADGEEKEKVGSDTESEEEDSGSDSDSDSADISDDEALSGLNIDKEMEAQFKAYLRTQEGKAAMEAEQERVKKVIERKQRQKEIDHEKDYVKGLLRAKSKEARKKNKGEVYTPQGILPVVMDYIFGTPGEQKSKKKGTEKG